MGRFEGKVAIVTGGANGIGAAVVERLAGEGAKVMIADMAEPAATSGNVAFRKTDVTSQQQVEAVVEAAVEKWGRLDMLVNNAGMGHLGFTLTMEQADWEKVFAVNTTAVFLCCKAAIPHMQARGGAIINIASISGLGGDYAMPAYNASKGAVVNYTRSLAMECAQYGIRVNAVCPGLVQTAMSEVAIARQEDRDYWFGLIPMGRAAQPSEMAGVVAFLASDDASYMTGVNVPVDGGVTAHTGQPNFPERQRLRALKAAE